MFRVERYLAAALALAIILARLASATALALTLILAGAVVMRHGRTTALTLAPPRASPTRRV